MKDYEIFLKSVYRCRYSNDVVNWYTCMMELLTYKEMCEIEITNINDLVEKYLLEFSKNSNTIVRRCWRKNEL